jgi:hypothetical protein
MQFEMRRLTATLIFDLKDQFATIRGTRGAFPRPFEPIRFFATAQGSGMNRREFETPLELVVSRNGGGYHVFRNLFKRPDGTKGTLLSDTYDLRVEGSFYQRAERANVTLPSGDQAVAFDLLPAYSYPFPRDRKPTGGRGYALLRGSLHGKEGKPIAKAEVSVVGANSVYVTDESGQWVLVFRDSFFAANQTTKTVTVLITPSGGPAMNVLNASVDKGSERTLAETALRGWVLRGGIGVSGATVTVQGRPGSARTGADGSWFYYFGFDDPLSDPTVNPPNAPFPVNVTAQLPDGSTQTQNNQLVRSRATVIVSPFRFP